jgi:hypothetical protein
MHGADAVSRSDRSQTLMITDGRARPAGSPVPFASVMARQAARARTADSGTAPHPIIPWRYFCARYGGTRCDGVAPRPRCPAPPHWALSLSLSGAQRAASPRRAGAGPVGSGGGEPVQARRVPRCAVGLGGHRGASGARWGGT